MGVREGSYIPVAEMLWPERRSLTVWAIDGKLARVGMVNAAFGFHQQQAGNARHVFIEELWRLTDYLAHSRPPIVSAVTAGGSAAAAGTIGLELDEKRGAEAFKIMRTVGAGLRSDLSDEMLAQLGLLRDDQGPELTFVNGEQSPVLWDMMFDYQDSRPSKVDWEKFWGFRHAITYWVATNRHERIGLHDGCFSAVAEDLHFAASEVRALTEHFRRRAATAPQGSLASSLRRRVEAHLARLAQEHGEETPDRPESCWDKAFGPANDWLHRFMKTQPEEERDGWKNDALVEIFNDDGFRYDLIHFACHCESSVPSQFLAYLKIKVAGEWISLDVSSISTYMSRKCRMPWEDPGPLVFLNACGTGQPGRYQEPSGFADHWIRHRGALAVVATLCPVPDHFAHAFALRFYEELLGDDASDPGRKRYLSDALLATRLHFLRKYNNPLGLAYVLYAPPRAHILVNSRRPGGRP